MTELPTIAASTDSSAKTESDAALLTQFLADRDVPCPRCAYNLRTLRGDRCTECGVALRLSVSPLEPFLRPWITSMVVASLGAGVGLLFLALILGNAGVPPEEWYWIVGTSWAFMPLVAVLAFGRRRMTRWPVRIQWSIAVGLLVVLIVLTVGIAKTVR